jgi:hypothetical protein
MYNSTYEENPTKKVSHTVDPKQEQYFFWQIGTCLSKHA